jgi:cytoskeletal protein RodZ
MQLDSGTDIEPTEAEGAAPEEGAGSNRTFILLAIPLVVVFLCIAAGLGYYAVVLGPQQRHTKETQAASIVLTNTQIAQQNAAIQQAQAATPTPVPPTVTPVPPMASNTPQPSKTALAGGVSSPTPLLAVTGTKTSVASATTAPSATTASGAVSTATPTKVSSPTKLGPSATPGKGTPSVTPLVGGLKTATPTQLPGTGFADEAGVPLLIIVSLALVAVVLVTRRLRLSLR